MPRLEIVAEGLRCLADRQQPVGGSVLSVGIAEECFSGQSGRLPLDAGDQLQMSNRASIAIPVQKTRTAPDLMLGRLRGWMPRRLIRSTFAPRMLSIRSRKARRSNDVKPSG